MIRLGTSIVINRLLSLFKQPLFFILTIIGHIWIGLGAFAFYQAEIGDNPNLQSALDSVYFAVYTVTTVGYGNIYPVTDAGKVISIFLMVGGSVLFWGYTALFASAIIAPELKTIESEITDIEAKLDRKSKDLSR